MASAIETLEDNIRQALDKVLLNTHASVWGRAYSITKEEERKACIEDLLSRLIVPMLKEMGKIPNVQQEIENRRQPEAISSNGRWHDKGDTAIYGTGTH